MCQCHPDYKLTENISCGVTVDDKSLTCLSELMTTPKVIQFQFTLEEYHSGINGTLSKYLCPICHKFFRRVIHNSYYKSK